MAGITLSILASPPNPRSANVAQAATSATHHWYQIGSATWYGREFAGRRTAAGETFDPNALTCAHRTLPLGSWVKVTNLRNRRSAFVRVNDRGPYVPSSIVDLSFAAAKKLGFMGRAQVKLEPVHADDPELAAAIVAQIPQPPALEQSLSR